MCYVFMQLKMLEYQCIKSINNPEYLQQNLLAGW